MLRLPFYFRPRYKFSYFLLTTALAVHSQQISAVSFAADGYNLEFNGDSTLFKVQSLSAANNGVLTVRNIESSAPLAIFSNGGGSVLLEDSNFSGNIIDLIHTNRKTFFVSKNGGRIDIRNSKILIKDDLAYALFDNDDQVLNSSDSHFNIVRSSIITEGKNSVILSIINNATLTESLLEARGKKSPIILFRGNGSTLKADNSTMIGDVKSHIAYCLSCGDLQLKNQSSLTGLINDIERLSLDDSRWELTKNSEFNHLNLKDGRVIFTPDGSFKNLSVDSLSGEGIFQMNTNLSAGKSDLLIVRGENAASGRHQLAISDSGNEPDKATEFQRLVFTHGGDAEFTLAGGHVDLGAYRYTLQKQGNNWQLTRGGNNAVVSTDAGAKKPLPEGGLSLPAASSSNSPDTGSGMPAASSGSSVAEAPASAGAATATVAESAAPAAEQSAAALTPAAAEQPAATLAPAVSEPPAPVAATTATVAESAAAAAEQPAAALAPAAAEQPAATVAPAVSEAPAPVAAAEQPAAATETITPEKPAMAEVNPAPELSSGANAALASQTALSGVVQSAAALPDQRNDAGRGGVWVKSSASRVSHAAGQARAFSQQRNATLLGVSGSAA
ncbi:pertactin-like passenger domain-containing protein, partial [Erwinia sp. Eh17-17]|uniref:pertactin-like passenger domain-containing protein n=1 Tax=Erwinia sp. Eh17-17 TaxID=3080330 RepID=UPI00320945C3